MAVQAVANETAPFYLLGLSSNAEPRAHLAAMIEALVAEFGELVLSRICVTEPFAVNDAEPFHNLAVLIRSERSQKNLKSWCRSLEDRLGRDRSSAARRSRVTADLDILARCVDCTQLHRLELVDEPYYLPMVTELVALAEGRVPPLTPAQTTLIRCGALELGARPTVLVMQAQRLAQPLQPNLLDCRLT